ncbi:DUF1570 domain-containing protein [Mucilaginibacter sp. PAMB04168]|uniref:DUF1570 domain-containing protein n=1 Tax=Mucilaginibacter sp. PAMB04168 TaxID=3138567 RepID=UPI0031F6D85C
MRSLDRPKQLLNYLTASKDFNRFSLAVTLLFLFLSLAAQAQKISINTIGGKLSQQDTISLSRLIKYQANIYNGLFAKSIPDSLPVVINLFSKRSQFNQAKKEANVTVTHTGFYSPATKECFVFKGEGFQHVINHEVSHLFMHFQNVKRMPRWVDEGLAEFFEEIYVGDNGAIYINAQPGRLQRMKEYVRDGKLDLYDFLSEQTNAGWNKKEELTFRYDVAYALVYYIVKTNPQFINHIFSALQDDKSSVDALGLVYSNLEILQNRLKLYYR